VKIDVYTDGSCFDTFGIGGWGVYIVIDSQKSIEFSGSCKCKDSINMEFLAIAKALEYINMFLVGTDNIDVFVYTDSDYIIKLIKQKNKTNKKAFPTRDKTSKRNKKILFDICNYQTDIDFIEWVLVKSHSGIKGNEIADRLAKKAAQKAMKNKT